MDLRAGRRLDSLARLGTGVPPALQIAVDAANIRDSRIQVTTPQCDQLQEVARLLSKGENEEAFGLWEDFIVELVESGVPRDIDSLVLWVLRSAYLETDPGLKSSADKVRFFNTLKVSLRSEIRRSEDFLKALVSKDDVATLNELLADLEALAEKERNASQQADTEFQSAASKDQQLFQLLSTILKSLKQIATEISRDI